MLACWPRRASVLAPSMLQWTHWKRKSLRRKTLTHGACTPEYPLPILHTKRRASDIKRMSLALLLPEIPRVQDGRMHWLFIFVMYDGSIPFPKWHIAYSVHQHATVQSLPSLRRIMQDLMFEPSREGPSISEGPLQYTPSTPAERYIHLVCEDKIAILAFLCEICIASRVIRAHIDWADASLTELRKEKIEVNREKRRLYACAFLKTSPPLNFAFV